MKELGGDGGVRVATARMRLWLLGYLPSDSESPTLDPALVAAIGRFQREADIAENGLGARTWEALDQLVGLESPAHMKRWAGHGKRTPVLLRAVAVRLRVLGFLPPDTRLPVDRKQTLDPALQAFVELIQLLRLRDRQREPIYRLETTSPTARRAFRCSRPCARSGGIAAVSTTATGPRSGRPAPSAAGCGTASGAPGAGSSPSYTRLACTYSSSRPGQEPGPPGPPPRDPRLSRVAHRHRRAAQIRGHALRRHTRVRSTPSGATAISTRPSTSMQTPIPAAFAPAPQSSGAKPAFFVSVSSSSPGWSSCCSTRSGPGASAGLACSWP